MWLTGSKWQCCLGEKDTSEEVGFIHSFRSVTTPGWKGRSLLPSIAITRRSKLWEPWSAQTCQHCVGSRAPLCWHVPWSRVCVSAICFKPEFLIIPAAQTLLESWYVLSLRHFFQQWVPLSNYIFCKKCLILLVWICHLLLLLHVLFFLFWEPGRVDLLCFCHSLSQKIISCPALIIFFLKFKKKSHLFLSLFLGIFHELFSLPFFDLLLHWGAGILYTVFNMRLKDIYKHISIVCSLWLVWCAC